VPEPASVAVAPPPARWGLHEAALGFAAAIVLSVLFTSAVLAGAGWETIDDAPIWGTALLQIPLWLGLGGAVVLSCRWRGSGSLRKDFGLSMVPTDVPFGLLVGIAAQYFVSYVVSWPVIELSGKSFDDYEKPARDLADKADASSWWGIALLVFVVVVMAPLIEELFYRGLVQRSLLRHFAPPAAIAITAVVFGLSHTELLQLPALVVFGLVVGILAHRTGRLGPGIWAHVGFNATTVVVLLWDRIA
jgi:uncharacterized protein